MNEKRKRIIYPDTWTIYDLKNDAQRRSVFASYRFACEGSS